jgi:hypothetical protein
VSSAAEEVSPSGPADHQATITGAVASGSRAAGIAFSLGYLLGLVPGPIFAVVGGLALITFGRSLLLDRTGGVLAASALSVAAAALGVGALRWETVALEELRGVQSVLGPSVAVGPEDVALSSAIAAGAAVVALGVWSALGPRLDRSDRVWLGLEALVAALAVGTVFLDPVRLLGETAAQPAVELASWAAVALVVTGLMLGLGWLLRRATVMVRGGVAAVSGIALVVAATLMVRALG